MPESKITIKKIDYHAEEITDIDLSILLEHIQNYKDIEVESNAAKRYKSIIPDIPESIIKPGQWWRILLDGKDLIALFQSVFSIYLNRELERAIKSKDSQREADIRQIMETNDIKSDWTVAYDNELNELRRKLAEAELAQSKK